MEINLFYIAVMHRINHPLRIECIVLPCTSCHLNMANETLCSNVRALYATKSFLRKIAEGFFPKEGEEHNLFELAD